MQLKLILVIKADSPEAQAYVEGVLEQHYFGTYARTLDLVQVMVRPTPWGRWTPRTLLHYTLSADWYAPSDEEALREVLEEWFLQDTARPELLFFVVTRYLP